VITMPMFLFAVVVLASLYLGYRVGAQVTARKAGWGNVKSGWRRLRSGRM
jgi:hypothetical protein